MILLYIRYYLLLNTMMYRHLYVNMAGECWEHEGEVRVCHVDLLGMRGITHINDCLGSTACAYSACLFAMSEAYLQLQQVRCVEEMKLRSSRGWRFLEMAGHGRLQLHLKKRTHSKHKHDHSSFNHLITQLTRHRTSIVRAVVSHVDVVSSHRVKFGKM